MSKLGSMDQRHSDERKGIAGIGEGRYPRRVCKATIMGKKT